MIGGLDKQLFLFSIDKSVEALLMWLSEKVLTEGDEATQ